MRAPAPPRGGDSCTHGSLPAINSLRGTTPSLASHESSVHPQIWEAGLLPAQGLPSHNSIQLPVEDDGENFFRYETAQGNYTVQVEILRLSGGAEHTGFEIVTFDYANAYTVDEFTNFADVNILEDGEYRIIYSSYDDINIDFGLQFSDWSLYGPKIVGAIVSLFIGVPAAIISFIVIIVMRSNSKKKNGEKPLSPHIDPAFIKKEEKKEQSEVDKHFDY